MRPCPISTILLASLTAFGADKVSTKIFTPDLSPAEAQQRDRAIRARLERGDLDSLANLLLLGSSFTKQPRIPMDRITEASKAGILRARVDDLAEGVRHPRDNERLLFVRGLLHRQAIDLENDPRQPGLFLLNNLQRVVKERIGLGERVAEADQRRRPDDPASLLERSSVFQDRGVSLDTGILPDFLIEQTLRDLKNRGVLREGQVARVAVVGPGLDFIDKNEGYAFDYYPQQTLQPFAIYDSLLRLGLARARALSVTVLDISPRVIEHVERARERAAKNTGYVVQLPKDLQQIKDRKPWPPRLADFWRALGDQVGTSVEPIAPPKMFGGLETRAVRVRPEVVRAVEPVDLNIVVERLALPEKDRFDLIVGTNIFVYYDAFEQTLALENTGAMLAPGGLLLTNDRMPEAAGGAMRLAGITVVSENAAGVSLAVGWYEKK